MTRKDSLSLDEFVTAPRKQPKAVHLESSIEVDRDGVDQAAEISPNEEVGSDMEASLSERRQEAKKALRQVKRERMKSVQSFVNVALDRDTKRRLKLASVTAETTMQVIMEKAIRKYLEENGH